MHPDKKQFFSTIAEGSLGDDYEQLSEIAYGSFGRVIRVREKFGNKQIRAIKQIQVDPISESQFDEVKKLKFLRQDHIVEYFGYILESNELNIVMEHCKGNLANKISEKGQFSRKQLIDLITQVTSAMLTLSSHNVMHLDLKPENILYVDDSFYKICDFGCSQLISNISKAYHNKSIVPLQIQNSEFGTPQYIAPEIQLDLKRTASNACDVWSLGVILYKMIYKKHPIGVNKNNKVETSEFSKFLQGQLIIEFKPTQTDYPIALIKSMLQSKPEKRITWRKIKEYLLANCARDEAQFINVEQACKSQIAMSVILANIVMVIDEGIDSAKTLFFFHNQDLLIQIKKLVLKLGFLLIEKFYEVFRDKMSRKLNASAFAELKFMSENILQEARNIPMQVNKEQVQLLGQYQQKLKQKLENASKRIEVSHLQQEFKPLQIFCKEAFNVKHLFCSGHKFPQTCKIFDINDLN